MRTKMIAAQLLSILLLLALCLVTVAAAQGPGDEREEVDTAGEEGLIDPPPVGFFVLYAFTGARDSQAGGTNSAATVVHCTNAGEANVQVRVEISDFDNDPTIFGSLNITPNFTRTFSSQDTLLYAEDFTMSTTDNIDQGSGRIMANNRKAKIICTAQVLDPLGNPPAYVVQLDLFKWK